MLVAQSCLTLCNSMAGSPPGSSVHGIFQARILEWVATPFSRGSFQHRNFISSYLCQHLLFSLFLLDYFFNTCYPNGCEVISHCGFDLICISLTISDVEHLFLGLLTIYIPFLEKAMATHSSTLAWKIPWTEEPGRLQSMASLRVRHD